VKIVEFQPKGRDVKDALDVIDDLRQAIVEGRIVAFAGVGISAEDETTAWVTRTQSFTRLRMMGALATLTHSFHAGDIQ
jgi:hypothetical protein